MTLRLGILGLGGHIFKSIAPALAECSELQVAAVWTRNESKRRDFAEEHSCAAADSVESLVSRDDVDVVYIASPTGLHAEMAAAALRHNKHVWVEKTLCTHISEWRSLAKTAVEKELAFFECFMFPFHPQFVGLKQLLESGRLGRIHSVQATFGFPHLDPMSTRYDPSMGGGAFLDAGVYTLKTMGQLSRDPDKLTLKDAVVRKQPEFEVDVAGSARWEIDSQFSGFGQWGFGYAYRNEIQIWSENYHVFVNRAFSKPAALETTITLTNSRGEVETIETGPGNHFKLMFETFASWHNDRTLREAKIREDLLHAERLFEILAHGD